MQCQQPQQVQRNPISHGLQKRSARPVDVVPQALVQNEAGEDERLRAHQEGDRRETEISKHYHREEFEALQSPLLPKYERRQMKKREWNNEFGRQQRPRVIVERLSDQDRK